ncbi:hypothetical protein F5882DRAFT_233163, partial [Hyaloscypha sp. PMI_1271]
HIVSAALLPKGYPVRSMLASVAVAGFLQEDKHKFAKEAEDIPDFAVDLLREVKDCSQESHNWQTGHNLQRSYYWTNG